MRLKVIFTIFLLVISFASISATQTTLEITSVPNHKVIAAVQEPSGYWIYESKKVKTPDPINIRFSTESSTYRLVLSLRQDGETIYKEKFNEEFRTGENMKLDFYPAWYSPPKPENKTNETKSNETTKLLNTSENNTTLNLKSENKTIEENKTKQEKITALVTAGEFIKSKTAQYIGGAIILGLIIFFASKRIKFNKTKKPKEIRIKKLSEIQANKENRIKEQEERIKKAKQEIEDAKQKIEKIRGEDKIAEVKKRLIEDEKELMRLRSSNKRDDSKSNSDENKE